MRSLATAALASLVVLAACTDEPAKTPTEPVQQQPQFDRRPPSSCPNAIQIGVQIAQVFKGPGPTLIAEAKFAVIVAAMAKHDVAKAVKAMTAFSEYILQQYQAGNLQGGKSDDTAKKVTTLINSLFCFVGLTPPNIPLGALGPDAGVGVVDQNTGSTTFTTDTKFAGIQIPSGAATTPTVVTITRLPDNTLLSTPLDQYPAFYEYHATPDGPFASDVVVGVCTGQNVTGELFNRLKIAHNVGTGVEILQKVPAPFLDCTNLQIIGLQFNRPGLFYGMVMRGLRSLAPYVLPEEAHAVALAQPGSGGSAKGFSPFGAVDSMTHLFAASQTSFLWLANQPVPDTLKPRVLVLTPLNSPVPGVSVTFKTANPGNGTLTDSVKTTGTDGYARVGSWTLGTAPRTDTVYAVATPLPGSGIDPTTVTFFGQAISPLQIDYGATDYRYKLIGSAPPPSGWETTGYNDSSWLDSTAAFGSRGSCPLDANVHTYWPAATTTSDSLSPSNTSDILIRHRFLVPDFWTGSVKVEVAIDNDLQVFVNGNNITGTAGGLTNGWAVHDQCATQGSFVFTASAANLLPGQSNVIAVHGRDRGVISYLDIKVTLVP
jgi:hypothetical protein